jgi:hypothetical protein
MGGSVSWCQDDDDSFRIQRRTAMKKLMTLMLGLCLALGTVAVTFAQADAQKEEGKGKGKGKGKSKADPKKKGGKVETPKKGA